MPQRLYARLALAFALILTAFAVALYFAVRASTDDFQREVAQRLSYTLAGHLRDEWKLTGNPADDPPDLDTRLGMLMVYHPGVDASVLDADGRVRRRAPVAPGPDGTPRAPAPAAIDLAPIQRYLAGDPLPIFGGDAAGVLPRHVFSVAPLGDEARPAGYLYVALDGRDAMAVAAELRSGESVRALGLGIAGVLAASLILGLLVFHFTTRRLTALRERVEHLRRDDDPASPTPREEIAALEAAFDALDTRIARQLDTIAAKDRQRRDTVKMVSHDLRTPLTSLRGYLDTLTQRYDRISEADRRRYLDVAARQCARLSRLTEQLFQLARLDCGDIVPLIEPFCVADLAQDLVSKFDLAAQARGVRLEAQAMDSAARDAREGGLAWVDADIGLIERVLENLLDNALRHTPAGGRISIEIAQRGGRVQVGVRDTGSGIDAARLARLLSAPPRTQRDLSLSPQAQETQALRDSDRPWGGVGLAVVRCIVELHGSRLEAESAPGLGSLFHFSLAAARGGEARVVDLASARRDAKGATYRRS